MTQERTIRSIRRGGMRLQLMDGSLWEIAVGDIAILATGMPALALLQTKNQMTRAIRTV
jgi:hypothetical protein